MIEKKRTLIDVTDPAVCRCVPSLVADLGGSVCFHCTGNHLVAECPDQVRHRDESEIGTRDKRIGGMAHRCRLCEYATGLSEAVGRKLPLNDAELNNAYKVTNGKPHETR